MATPISELLVKITADNSGLNKGMDSAVSKSDEAINKMMSKAAQLAAAYLGFNKVLEGIEFNKMAEQAQISFGVMLGSAEEAQKLVEEMFEFAKTTPLEFSQVREAGKQLLAFGIESDNIIETLRMLGDVASGIGAPIGDIAYLFGTISTQGRAMTVDINQFANRGIPIWEELAKVTGKNGEELRKIVEQGKIGFPEIEKAFQNMTSEGGKFGGMMEKLSDSLTGAESNLNDAFQQFLGTLTSGLTDDLTNAYRQITENIGDLSDNFKAWGDTAGATIESAVIVVDGLLSVLDLIPGQLTLIAAGAIAAGAAFGPWGAAIAAGVLAIETISSELDKLRGGVLNEYWKPFTEGLNLSASEAARFYEKAQDISLTFSKIVTDTPQVLDTIVEWKTAIDVVKNKYGLTYDQIGVIIDGTNNLTEKQRIQAEAAIESGKQQQAVTEGQKRIQEEYTQRIEQTAKLVSDEEQKAIARAAAEEARQKSINDWLDIQDQLRANGIITESEYYNNRIDFQEKLIDGIISQAEKEGSLTNAMSAEILKRQAYIEGYNEKLSALVDGQIETITWGEGQKLQVYTESIGEIEAIQKLGFDNEEKNRKDSIKSEKQATVEKQQTVKEYWDGVEGIASAGFTVLDGINKELGLGFDEAIKQASQVATGIMGLISSGGTDPAAWASTIVGAIGIVRSAFDVLSGEEQRRIEEARIAEATAIEENAKKRLATKLEVLDSERAEEISKALAVGAQTRDIEIYYARAVARAKLEANESILEEQRQVEAKHREILAAEAERDRLAALEKARKSFAILSAMQGRTYSEADIVSSGLYRNILNEFTSVLSSQAQAEMDAIEMSFALFGDRAEEASKGIANAFISGFKGGSTKEEIKASIFEMLQNMAIEAALMSAGIGDQFEQIGAKIAEALTDGVMSGLELYEIQRAVDDLTTKAEQTLTSAMAVFGGMKIADISAGVTGTSSIGTSEGSISPIAAGNTYITTINSPTAVSPAEASKLMTTTLQDLAFMGV